MRRRDAIGSGYRHRHRGGMSVTAMLLLLALVGMLGLLEIGYLYWAKRDAQKVADLAALAGAQSLELCNAANSDNQAARGNAVADNRFPGALAIECGYWQPGLPVEQRFTRAQPAGQVNAVHVRASRPMVPLFAMHDALPTISASAIAIRTPPQAAFSVGAQLLRINGQTPLGTTLSLVGVDLDSTTVLGYDGLAQVRVTPRGLLDALGIDVGADLSVAELDALLSGRQVSVAQLLDASVSLIRDSGVATLDLRALRNALQAELDINALSVPLGSTSDNGGLFARLDAGQASVNNSLDVELGLYEILNTSIAIAGDRHAVDLQHVNLLGLAHAQVGIIEAPSIAIGGPGSTAYNAQIRVFLDVDSNNVPVVSTLLALLGMRLKLPVHVDLANAMGTLQSIDCGSRPETATVNVQSSVLRACVGQVPEALRFSRQDVCAGALQDETMLRLLGLDVVRGSISLPALSHSGQLTLAAGETGSTGVNPLEIGSAVDRLVTELLKVLSRSLAPPSSVATPAQTANQLALHYASAVNPQRATVRHDVDAIVAAMRNGVPGKVQPLGDWQLTGGLPTQCLPLRLTTCWQNGSVWDSFRLVSNGQGFGTLDNLLGFLLGGLLVNRCNSLLTQLLNYNQCIEANLASYIQTAPAGLLDAHGGTGSITDPGTDTVACSGLLCLALKPVLDVLKPILNGIGTLLSQSFASLLGIELGRTDVAMHSIQCRPSQLVQ